MQKLLFIDDTEKIPKIYFNKIYDDKYMSGKESTFFDVDDHFIIDKDFDIYTDNDVLLAKFRKNLFSTTDTNILFDNMKSAAPKTRGRAKAAGIPENGEIYSYIKSKSTGKMIHQLNTYARSGIVGYYDNNSFFGHKYKKDNNTMCRQTAFTGKNIDKFKNCLGIFKKVDYLYENLLNEYYNIQKSFISKINPEYVIKDTVFTTVTVNKNFRTALHKDSGDLKNGFGNLLVISNGEYEGGYTLFPQYGFGVDCKNGDFLLMDVHEWHCNSPIIGNGTRISFVFYLREKMLKTCPLN